MKIHSMIRKLLLSSFAALSLGAMAQEAEPITQANVDICIYGSTPAGIMAAYTAKLKGKSVLLVSPTKRLGGTKGLERLNLCLHVGAGTFLPVKSRTIGDHTMHSEPFSVSRLFLERLLAKGERPLTAVGTTSTRCLESLYYLGVHCIEKGEPGVVEQWEPYRTEGYEHSLEAALRALLAHMDRLGTDELLSRTRIIIVPGFRFRLVDYLVTNFHQPKSTLLLLIGAFIGEAWREVYRFALANDFRFLSYGDASLLQKE